MALALNMPPAGPSRTRGETSLEADRQRAFSAARRHTALVRLMRFSLPVAAVGVVGFYAVALLSSFSLSVGNVRVGQVEVTSEDLTMKNPSYFGTTQDGGKYEIRAKKAILEFNQNAPVKLVDIDGDMIQANNVKTVVRARRGLYDNNKSELTLFDGIEIDSSNGMKARLTEATIYSKESKVVSKKPVEMSSATGEIRGNSVTFNTASNQAVFLGQVNVRLAPTQTTQAPQKPAVSATPAFGRDSKQPIDVRSERFDLDDGSHVAMFTGEVVATQGDSTLKTPELMIAYEGKAADSFVGAAPQAKAPAADDTGGVSRLYARSGVVVTMGLDRHVTSDVADFDAKADTALFTGNVLITQGKNTLQGKRLWLERKVGRTRLDSPGDKQAPPGRIAATFFPEQSAHPAPKPKATKEDPTSLLSMGTFKSDPNAPMDIDAESLEVLEAQHVAAFRGAVKAQQGDFVVKAPEMLVFLNGQNNFMTGAGPDGADKNAQQISRIEARNKVVISSKEGDQATGDKAIFDVKGNNVLLLGNVSIIRANDVGEVRKVGVKGERLKIDLTTGMYRFENDEKATAAAAEAARVPPPVINKAPDAKATSDNGFENRPCPPGRQCLLAYPKEIEDKAKQVIKALPAAPAAGWEPSTSASPVQRGN
ncbi:MAG: LPS export ABC transporter periplasmic protein LptC [Hyphomicrobiales bacterium]|nr:MAG: LPS export ABC transporter periplasmic protein LptC [Hyphomicrobiales bacterium]